ncbi:IS1595 family transposase [Erythrobacter crassostreae]|uniref:IS1595 family transposase n=1 Tax=Erythrobacter crassostreae TaxID=2828328 RepID=A0A9X1JMC9_9SPHN|nr:IS1595 family transposase [Erythrobacter crassostrea]MBV7259284.1 IS1595 family transposase [Erythrobacter crassostrea]
MTKPQTIAQFFARFPDDETCLNHIFEVRFGQGFECPSCERDSKWFRIKAERAYSCQWCGHHLHPTVGTPFERTRTPLQLWFYAIFLFTTTRNGVAAKELQRQLGVTYKTAWRMADKIREHMADVDGDVLIGGEGKEVEVDETLVGGATKGGGRGNYRINKTVVLGMVERGGDVVTKIVPNNRKSSLLPVIKANVLPDTHVHTDQNHTYRNLPAMGYGHEAVNHNQDEWVRGNTHVQTIEGFWSQLKRSINGTHVHVSGKHLWKYAKEAEYRFNRRHRPEQMLPELLSTFRPLNGA